VKISDRTLAGWGIIIGVAGCIVGAVALWFAAISSPWSTHNELFCYRHKGHGRVGGAYQCYFTRSDCERAWGLEPLKDEECGRVDNFPNHGTRNE
jgi:hypothetical protein